MAAATASAPRASSSRNTNVRPNSITTIGYTSNFKLTPWNSRSSVHLYKELYPSSDGPFCDHLLPRPAVHPPIVQRFRLNSPVLAGLLRQYSTGLRDQLQVYMSPAISCHFIIDSREALDQAEEDWANRPDQDRPREWEQFVGRVVARMERVMGKIVKRTQRHRKVPMGVSLGVGSTKELVMEHAVLFKLLNELDAPIRSWWRFKDLINEARRRYNPTCGQVIGDVVTAPVRFTLRNLCCMGHLPSWLNPRRRPFPRFHALIPESRPWDPDEDPYEDQVEYQGEDQDDRDYREPTCYAEYFLPATAVSTKPAYTKLSHYPYPMKSERCEDSEISVTGSFDKGKGKS